MFLYIFLLLAFLTNVKPSVQQHNLFYVGHVCSSSTYLKKSTYSSNLRTLLSSLSSNNQSFSSGFYSTAAGQNPDLVFGLFLCRGDFSPEICRDCVVHNVGEILDRCPNGKTALIYFDECMLRYSDRNILLDPTSGISGILMMNHQNVTANISDRFDKVPFFLMSKAAEEAAASLRKFAITKVNITSSQTVYVMVQCTPDLTRENCSSCLRDTINQLPRDKIGGRLLWPSCTLRYEPYPFFNETFMGTQLPPPVSAPPLPPRQALLPPPLPPRQTLLPPPQPGKSSLFLSLSLFTSFMEF